jgi:hypothetical protein
MNDLNDRLIFIFHLSAKMGGFMISCIFGTLGRKESEKFERKICFK